MTKTYALLIIFFLGVKIIQWEIENEQTAIVLFEKHTGLCVLLTGLWLYESGETWSVAKETVISSK